MLSLHAIFSHPPPTIKCQASCACSTNASATAKVWVSPVSAAWRIKNSQKWLIHPWKLIWDLNITHLQRKIIFQTSIIVFHVNFLGCISSLKAGTSFPPRPSVSMSEDWMGKTPRLPVRNRQMSLPVHQRGPGWYHFMWIDTWHLKGLRSPAPASGGWFWMGGSIVWALLSAAS